MKYVLVDNYDNIIIKIDLTVMSVYLSKSILLKQMPKDEDFEKLWKVMSEQEYDTRFKSSLQNRQVEWWKEEPSSSPDEDFDY